MSTKRSIWSFPTTSAFMAGFCLSEAVNEASAGRYVWALLFSVLALWNLCSTYMLTAVNHDR